MTKLDKHGKALPLSKNMTKHSLLDDRLTMLLPSMKFGGMEPNNSQQAVALSVAKLVTQRITTKTISNRTMIQMPAGMGKSLVIGLLTGLLETAFTTVTLLYSDKDLRDFEVDMVAGLKTLLSDKELNVIAKEELTETNDRGHPVLEVPHGSLVIVDEADSLFLDSYCQISGDGAVVGLTATSADAMHSYEQTHMLATMAFQFIQSGMEAAAVEENVMEVASFDEFFATSPGVAHIVYCSEAAVEQVEEAARKHVAEAIIRRNGCTRKDLHGNTERNVVVVTEERLMRGFDYRAPMVGFALLIAKKLSSRRAFRQALGRAGRMGEQGQWAKMAGVDGYPEGGTKASADILRRYMTE